MYAFEIFEVIEHLLVVPFPITLEFGLPGLDLDVCCDLLCIL